MDNATQIKTFLWFNNNLNDALAFYQSIFHDLVVHSTHEKDVGGTLSTADFSIGGHRFTAMNWPGGPEFNDAISLSVNCDGQSETDRLWEAITTEGTAGNCGWCKDAFGLSWQINPIEMHEHLGNPDPVKSAYAWQAFRKMNKIVLKDLYV